MKHVRIVNVPGNGAFFGKQMRRCFITKPGYKLIGCDSVSCQDRALAALANNASFTKMMLEGDKEKGTDGHTLNMKAINKVLERKGYKPISRSLAKNAGYGLKFGAGDNKLASTIGCDRDTAAECREAMAEVLSAQFELVERLTKEWRGNARKRLNSWGRLEYFNGWVEGLDGRPVKIPSEHQVLVFMLQHIEALVMSAAYNMFVKNAERKGWKYGDDFGIVTFQHDELQIEAKEGIAEEAGKLAAKCIEDASRFWKLPVLQQGDYEIGNNWSETH